MRELGYDRMIQCSRHCYVNKDYIERVDLGEGAVKLLGEEEKIPLILLVRWNTPCMKKLGLALDLLAQREIAVVGVILTDVDARFLHAYYKM